MNRFTRAWRAGVAGYREGVSPDLQPPVPGRSPADQKSANLITLIAGLIAGCGAYLGWLLNLTAHSWIIFGLVVADVLLLTRLYLTLRSQAPLDRRNLFTTGAIIAGFSVFGFSGSRPIALVHLATCLTAFGITLFWTGRSRDKIHHET